jgi:hypothetical protein
MNDGPGKFISQTITVSRDEQSGKPVSFTWDGETYSIREIIATWQDYGFSAGAPKKKTWRMRRHRTCYRVETTAGEVFDIYHDRGMTGEGGRWILQTQVS